MLFRSGFTYTYSIDSSRLDGKRSRSKIRRVNIDDLEKAVKDAGYEWRKLDD